MLDGTNVEQLRWVGTHFVYFLDIPYVEIYSHLSQPSPNSDGSSQSASDEPHEASNHDSGDTDSFGGSSGASLRTVDLIHTLTEGVMNKTVPMDRIVSRDEKDRTIISGNNLAMLLVPWARGLLLQREYLAHDPTHQQHGRKARTVLMREITAFDDAVATLPYALDDDILAAVATFLVSVSKCAEAIWGNDEAFYWYDNTWLMAELNHVFRRKLQSKWGSWIADQIKRIGDAGIPFISYAISCEPTLNKVATGMAVANVGRDPEKIPHVTSECTCALVKPSMDDVREALLVDDVPAVVFDGVEPVVRPASEGPYVAISHVWADGLGSSTEIGLPRCQVERLDAVVRKLVPDGAFWHDGLCVPSPETEKQVWQRAIKLLARTYAGADKVLVIDGGIRTQSSLTMPREECLLRIATSGWMQRIWTLQEGLLA